MKRITETQRLKQNELARARVEKEGIAPLGTITEKEAYYLKAIIDSEYHDGRDVVGSQVWTFSCGDECKTKSGVFSSLIKKGFVVSQEGDPRDKMDYDTCCITQKGYDAFINSMWNQSPE
jgi:hypothetical protein